jgi:IMP dehydrogenase
MDAFTFDDINLISKESSVRSGEVALATDLGFSEYGPYNFLRLPLISAAMDTVTEVPMMQAMRDLGAIGMHHRYRMIKEELFEVSKYGIIAVSPSMGFDFIYELSDCNPHAIVKIDVANGELDRALQYADWCNQYGLDIISGNVTTLEAALKYVVRGCRTISVGQGNGGACSTRMVTGFGYPQASAILNMRPLKAAGIKIIADGGIRNSGDLVKALALGADAVILGSLLAGCDETPGKNNNGYKNFRGMASAEALESAGKEVRPEGVSTKVPARGPVADVINDLVDSVKLAIGKYGGCRTIPEFQEKVEWIRISQAAYEEGKPRYE